uniref:HTH OST-type domain-containing protein n=1 Tax=Parastrongyloides trichosuri TaxID=131310 RepID=A0A0N4ZKC6_PARTI
MGRLYDFRPDSDDVFEGKLYQAMKEDGRVDFNVRNLPDVCEKCSIPINYWDYMTKSSPIGKHWSYHIDRMIKKGLLRARKYKSGNPIEFSVVNVDGKSKKDDKSSSSSSLEYKGNLSTLFMEQLFHVLLHTNIEIINVDKISSYCRNNNVSLNYWATIKGSKGLLKQYLKCMENKNMLKILEFDKHKYPINIKINRDRESVIRHIEDKDNNNNSKKNVEGNNLQYFSVGTVNSSTSSYDNAFLSPTTYEKYEDDVFLDKSMVNNKFFNSSDSSPKNMDKVLQNDNVFASINSLGLLEDYNVETEIENLDEKPGNNCYLQSMSSDYNSFYNFSSYMDIISPIEFKNNLFNCMEKGTFYTIEALQEIYRCYFGTILSTSLVNDIFHTNCHTLDVAIYSNLNGIMLRKSDNGSVSICRY